MKKIILLLTLLLTLTACNNSTNLSENTSEPITVPTTDTAESLILVTTNGETTAPFVNLVWATVWTENGWLAADGFPLTDMLPKIINELPIIRYRDDFSVQYKDGVSFSGLSIFDNNFDRLHHNVNLSYLDELSAGTYYIGIQVTGQGKYIESENEHEAYSYECIFKLVVKK